MSERGHRAVVDIGRHDEAGFQKCLKTVTDTEDQALFIAELAKNILQKVLQLDCQNLARGDIIAIGEAAGNCHNLVL